MIEKNIMTDVANHTLRTAPVFRGMRQVGDHLRVYRGMGQSKIERRVQFLFACANEIQLSRRQGKLYFLAEKE